MTDEKIMEIVRYSTVGSNAIPKTEWCAFARAVEAATRNSLSPSADWIDALHADVSAIDTWYRGSPSYEHDAGWLKDRVLKMLDERIEAANPDVPAESSRADTWVSVDERFPPDGEMVLVCVRNAVQSADEDAEEYECEVVHVVDFGQFKEPGGYMECFAGPHGAFADDITHWQPLPKPPADAAIESQRSEKSNG